MSTQNTQYNKPVGIQETVLTVNSLDRPRKIRPVHEKVSLFQHGLESDRPVVESSTANKRYATVKRGLDIVGACVLLLLLSPIMLTTLVILTIATKGSPFFVQRRIGYLGIHFPMIKFRTMRINAEKMQHLVENQHEDGPIFKNRKDPRITWFGSFLRRSSIDEMPQLLNVLAGHMSLVGPRPPIHDEVADYESWQRRRLSIKPGLTCLWQISGRSEVGFKDWVRMDLWYMNNQSFLVDLWLLVKTPWCVLTGRGAY